MPFWALSEPPISSELCVGFTFDSSVPATQNAVRLYLVGVTPTLASMGESDDDVHLRRQERSQETWQARENVRAVLFRM